ncbi:hypothetical protein ACFWAR_00595 [Streptomyces sp. NPDC059917]|uniref:hypothetical protein n=1 Tax=Streptomyces sp. NPDC059917 TaxID=3347002 RepID=UPI003650F73D
MNARRPEQIRGFRIREKPRTDPDPGMDTGYRIVCATGHPAYETMHWGGGQHTCQCGRGLVLTRAELDLLYDAYLPDHLRSKSTRRTDQQHQ